MAAGLYATSPRKFLGYQALSAVCFPAHLGLASSATGFSGFFMVGGFLVAVLLGWTAPMTIREQAGTDAARDRSTTTCPSSSTSWS